MGEKRNAYRILMGKPERKRPIGRPRRRWVDNIKTDLREIGWGRGEKEHHSVRRFLGSARWPLS
jgi:hypothetical protein